MNILDFFHQFKALQIKDDADRIYYRVELKHMDWYYSLSLFMRKVHVNGIFNLSAGFGSVSYHLHTELPITKNAEIFLQEHEIINENHLQNFKNGKFYLTAWVEYKYGIYYQDSHTNMRIKTNDMEDDPDIRKYVILRSGIRKVPFNMKNFIFWLKKSHQHQNEKKEL